MRKAVFFDRDGVLNRAVLRDGAPHSPGHLGEFEILPGTREALESLRRADYLLIVVTNQPDVARGIQTREVVERMHAMLMMLLPLDAILVCYHGDQHQCACRKPLPGLLLQAARDWKIRLSGSYMIGDRQKDLEAGRRAGCQTVLLRYPYNENESQTADCCARTLLDAVKWIVGTKRGSQVPVDMQTVS